MNYLYSTQEVETSSLIVQTSPVWEVILGIAGYTHAQLRHTFDLDEMWSLGKSIPDSLIKHLAIIEKTNFWFGLILLQDKFSSTTICDFSKRLSEIDSVEFYEIVLPYKDRMTDYSRKNVANKYKDRKAFETYATYFNDHDYLGDYICNLGSYTYQDICDLYQNVLEEWHNWVSKNQDWAKWNRALDFEMKQYNSLEKINPVEAIEQITGGVKYFPEPSVWTIKLIPQISYRPWTLAVRTPETKLYFYPLKEEYLLESGIPSMELIRGHKALGDEIRLKILYQLVKGSSSLQDLSVQFNISKTTLHHQLTLLKAAKFIQADKGIYSANTTQINAFSERLIHYLDDLI
ncbi:MAG: ArsR/SmtB family transcription factor [Paenisporosarcina sp.]